MSAQVVKCNVCGARFNGAVYAQCPYCQDRDNGSSKGKTWPWSKRKTVQEDRPAVKPTEDPDETKTKQPAQTDCLVPHVPEPVPPTWGAGDYPTPPVSEEVPPTVGFPDCPVPFEVEPKLADTRPENPVPTPKPGLAGEIQKLGKTTAKYINTSSGDVTYPAVGWLVCVKGVYYGQSFPLKSGINKVGRSPEMDVALLQDESVSRNVAVKIGYDSRANEFNALLGESGELCYIAGKALYERVTLKGFEEIEFGDSGDNKFIFVPLCGDRFQWSDYPTQK